jgi:hypothetical protein
MKSDLPASDIGLSPTSLGIIPSSVAFFNGLINVSLSRLDTYLVPSLSSPKYKIVVILVLFKIKLIAFT